jgi:glycosyltransferase involved in cell wall biosynthesis
VTAVHQFLPVLEPSAVGAHAMEARRILRDMGLESEIFADGTHPTWADEVQPYKDYGRRARADDILLYQAAVGSVVADYLLERSEPLVVNYHNVTPARFFRRWEPDVVHALQVGARQVRRLAPRAAAGIADSAYNEGELRDLGYRRTTVAPVLFDVDAVRSDVDETVVRRLMADKERGGADLLFVGRVAPHKAQHDLVKALAAYRRAYDPAARLHIVGGSSSARYWTTLERYVDALGLQDAVHLAGSVSAGALAAHYRVADALVCLSEHEGFCIPLVEAMASDVPIVAFRAAAVPETLAGAGILLDSKDPATVAAAVHRVIDDADLRRRLVEAGRARLDEFSGERLRDQFRAAMSEVIAEVDRR